MKKTKLLPLVGIGAICTTVTPLAILTGCNNNNNGFINVLNRYLPKGIEQHGSIEYDSDEATGEYGAALKENPNLFKEDFYWYVSNEIRNLQQYAYELKEVVTPALKDVIYGKIVDHLTSYGYNVTLAQARVMPFTKIGRTHDIKIDVNDVQSITPEEAEGKHVILLSFTLNYNYKYEDYTVSGHSSINDIEEMSGSTEFRNVPYVLYNNPSNNLWAITPNVELARTQRYYKAYPWSITYTSKLVYTEIAKGTPYGDYEIVETKENNYEWQSGIEPPVWEYDVLQSCLEEDSSCYSWFMWKVRAK